MKTPTVTFAGVYGAGATSYDWELIPGTRPVTRRFTVTDPTGVGRAAVAKLRGQLTTVKIEGPRKTFEAKKVYVLGIHPGDRPGQFSLHLADVRHVWPKRYVSKSFNVRRATGATDARNDAGDAANVVLTPQEEYAAYSLLDSSAEYTAEQALGEVFGNLGTSWRYADGAKEAFTAVEIEGLRLDDYGDAALERVLAYIPGAGVYIDSEGFAVIYDTAKRIKGLAEAKHFADGPFSGLADLAALRPKSITVLFTREVECNLVFRGPRTNATLEVAEDSNSLINVVPVCASSLEIGGRTYSRGSWVPIDDWLEAIGPTPSGKTLTQDIIRRTMLGGRLSILVTYVFNGLFPDAVWQRRIDMIRTHWRRTFQIEPIFWSRMEAMVPYRTAVLNFSNGSRVPSEVFCDYLRRPSFKYKDFLDDPNSDGQIGIAVRGYNDSLAGVQAAPVRVVTLDPAAGIITCVPLLDPDGFTDQITLGYPDGKTLPSVNLGEINKLVKDAFAQWLHIRLEPDFRLRLIVTFIPASPNDNGKFLHVRVKPEDTRFAGEIGECLGPDVTIRVMPGVITSRDQWEDSQGPAILDALKGNGPMPGGRSRNAPELTAVAKAFAERHYEALLDRPMGSAVVDMDPAIVIDGNITSVRHEMRGGATVTRVTYGAPQQARDIWRYLDSSTRKVIMRNLHTRDLTSEQA